MARSYCRLLLNTLPRLSNALASLGSSRTASLASASARSRRPVVRNEFERSRKAREFFGSSAMARSRSANPIDVIIDRSTINERGGQFTRLILGRLDQGGAGGDALFGRIRAVIGGGTDIGIGAGLRPSPRRGKCSQQTGPSQQQQRTHGNPHS